MFMNIKIYFSRFYLLIIRYINLNFIHVNYLHNRLKVCLLISTSQILHTNTNFDLVYQLKNLYLKVNFTMSWNFAAQCSNNKLQNLHKYFHLYLNYMLSEVNKRLGTCSVCFILLHIKGSTEDPNHFAVWYSIIKIQATKILGIRFLSRTI